MYLSFAVMTMGLLWWLLAGMSEAGVGGQAPAKGLPINSLFSELAASNPMALLNLGVLFLLATPGATLLSVIGSYIIARNWRYAGMAALIGVILLLSLALSMKWIRLF